MKSRNTKQKELLKEKINGINGFFTAEELYSHIKNKKISLATVYRILKELKEKRELHSYLCGRKTIYSKEENSHSHFICQKCNKIIHFEVENIDFIKKKVKGSICHFQVDVTGTCEECLDKLADKI